MSVFVEKPNDFGQKNIQVSQQSDINKLDELEKYLADSFELFRQDVSHMNATRTSSDMAADYFTKRFLNWHKTETAQLLLEARLDELRQAETHIGWTAGYVESRKAQLKKGNPHAN